MESSCKKSSRPLKWPGESLEETKFGPRVLLYLVWLKLHMKLFYLPLVFGPVFSFSKRIPLFLLFLTKPTSGQVFAPLCVVQAPPSFPQSIKGTFVSSQVKSFSSAPFSPFTIISSKLLGKASQIWSAVSMDNIGSPVTPPHPCTYVRLEIEVMVVLLWLLLFGGALTEKFGDSVWLFCPSYTATITAADEFCRFDCWAEENSWEWSHFTIVARNLRLKSWNWSEAGKSKLPIIKPAAELPFQAQSARPTLDKVLKPKVEIRL